MPNRVGFILYVNLDPTPGEFYSVESAKTVLQQILTDRIPHYRPTIALALESKTYADWAILVQPDDLRAGGELFTNGTARVGEYFVRSDDPEKRDLSLPPHIFRRCFRFILHENVGRFAQVEEIV